MANSKSLNSTPSLFSTILVFGLISTQILVIFLHPLRQPLRLVLVLLSLWLGIGAAAYGVQYSAYLARKQSVDTKFTELSTKEMQWKMVLKSHPTSREALLGAYSYSVALGETQQAAQYKALLLRIDPNDERVKNLE